MTTMPVPLDKNPPLPPEQDFYRLRREGIGLLEDIGSAQWTDYNVHDPGITLLETLCFAITDLGFRLDWKITDILMPQAPSSDPAQPYPNQAFFTARDILTVNPTTSDDFRRLLIDLPGVKDAWLTCKACACEVSWYAWCDVVTGNLMLGYKQPASGFVDPPKEAWALGLYEALLELEEDPALGDLNDRMIEYDWVYHDADGAHPVTMELRFPDSALLDGDQWNTFLDSDFVFANDAAFTVELTALGATKTYDVFTALANPADRDAYIQAQWKNVFYLSFRITLLASGHVVVIDDAALRVFGDAAVRNAVTADAWKTLFADKSASGFIQRYRKKAKATRAAVESAKTALQSHRNLDEDYCTVAGVGIEDVAVCADIEVKPDADIEKVQAEIWFAIEQYMSPPILFHTLAEMQAQGTAVEDIFNGPALDSGFIDAADLAAAALKSTLRASDIINALMDIDGVIAVNQLRLTKYDSEGNTVSGAADPTWANGEPVFDPNKVAAAWLLFISPRHQPRLYLNQSRFLFLKNGLPFLPRMDEATDTLTALRGDAERPKNPNAPNDLPVPAGVWRNPDDYQPVQYSLPLAYGVGPAGLPAQVPPARKAQAIDLKAYLMVFEQLIGNALEQFAHTADLFSLDPAIGSTYFVKTLGETQIKGFDAIKKPLLMTPVAVAALVETQPEFYARRNLFLDHLLARFGEQFKGYALLLTNAAGDVVAQPRLIENKIAFLKRYPAISHDRAKAFDYTLAPTSPDNYPGIKKRISLLLGYPDLAFAWTVGAPAGSNYPAAFVLADFNGRTWLNGTITVSAASAADAKIAAYRAVIERMILSEAYIIAVSGTGYTLTLVDAANTQVAQDPQLFAAQADAAATRDELLAWAATDRMIVVEHLLLRPKFIGDALYPACCEGGCMTCGAEDPYSFRLTYVMPGWTEQYTDDLDLRGYANSTLQQETPSHLVPKTCWVGNDGFEENLCDEAIGQIADLLIAQGKTGDGTPPLPEDACACANAIYHAFSGVFTGWYADRKFAFIHADALAGLIGTLFATTPAAADVSCTTVFDAPLWQQVRDRMIGYFVGIAANGWQFERFEWAWNQWLAANTAIDWTEEKLLERVEAILQANVTTAGVKASALCQCARGILEDYGTAYYTWMQGNVVAGNAYADLTTFAPPAITLCAGMTFNPGTADTIAALLIERYRSYAPASYWLWAVVTLLGGLRNTYPGATLHDCDDGSDQNPVRLDNTALGNYPRRTTLA
jgi:hypothetical protein